MIKRCSLIGSSVFFLSISLSTITSAQDRVYLQQAGNIMPTARVKQAAEFLGSVRSVRRNPVAAPVRAQAAQPQATPSNQTRILEFGLTRPEGSPELPQAHISVP